jgi:hypothetical protein
MDGVLMHACGHQKNTRGLKTKGGDLEERVGFEQSRGELKASRAMPHKRTRAGND